MNRRLRFALLSILLLSLAPGKTQAQRSLGVMWEVPAAEPEAIQQLHQFRDLGIRVLELQQSPSGRVWSEIDKLNFSVYGDLGILFPTAHTFAGADSTFTARVSEKMVDFTARPSVKALNLFTHGAIHQAAFIKAADSFFNPNRPPVSIKTHYTGNMENTYADLPAPFFIYDIRLSLQNRSSLSIPDVPALAGFRYHPSRELKELLMPLQRVVRLTAKHPQKPLFVESEWLLSMVETHPRLKTTLRSLSSDSDPIFPIPGETWPPQSPSSLPVIALLLVWGTLALHYNTSPLYRKSLFRYFTGHRFFLSDIFHQHIRSPFPALIIITQHALLTAAVLFAVVSDFWPGIGLDSLIFHFPNLFLFSGSKYGMFITFFVLALMFSFASILWLYFSHNSLRSINQAMTIFAWPLQVNILLGSLAIAIHVSDGNPGAVAVLAGLILVVCLWSFIMAALDASQHPATNRPRYISLTAGIFLLLHTALAIWLLEFNDPLWQVIDLSLELK